MSLLDNLLGQLQVRSTTLNYVQEADSDTEISATDSKIWSSWNDYIECPVVHAADQALLGGLKFNIDTGPWIAGGAVMQWVEGRSVHKREEPPPHDIDVFFRDQEQFTKFFEHLWNLRSYQNVSVFERHRSKNAITVDVFIDNKGWWTIQCIQKNFYESAQEVIDHFDIRACMLVTDGRRIVAEPEAFRDIHKKQLVIKNFRPESALKRIVKYMAYGYKYSPELIKQLEFYQNELCRDFSDETDYDSI